MSETPMLPTLRLLEPRALVAADRVASRVMDRSGLLLRRLDSGPLRFASRMFETWFGPPVDERAPSARAARGPRSLELARPWYELPSVWPQKGIVLGGRPRPEAARGDARPLGRGPIEDLRALELVDSYAPPEQTSADQRPAPVPVSGAPVVLAARLADSLTRVEQMLRTSAMSTSRTALARPTLELVSATDEVAPSRAPARASAFSPTLSPAVALSAARRVTVRVQAPAAAAPVELQPALQPAVPLAWPRVQRFVERLAGPTVLERAGTITPAGELALRPLERVRPVASFARELVSPLDAAPNGRPADAPLRRAATSLGEIARVEQPRSLGFPGRLAQHAELLGTVAAQRVDRELGLGGDDAPRSILRSADAFSVEHLDGAEARRPTADAPGPTARVGDRAAPRSIASLLAFADAQIGTRLLDETRALPVAAPRPTYVVDAPSPEAPRGADRGRGTTRAQPDAPTRAWAPPRIESPAAAPVGLVTTLGAAASSVPARAFGVGQLGVRTEQLAGEVGLHAASLSTEFMFEADAEAAASGAEAAPAIARAAQRGWLSTSEWALLSLFPTQATAQQIARQVAARASEMPALAYVSGVDGPASPRTEVPRARSASAVGGVASSATAPVIVPPVALPATAHASEAFASELGARALAAPDRAVPGAPLVMLLPDGRRPRGARVAPRAVGLRLAADDAPHLKLSAGVEAAERRVESPVGVPLWGQLPHLQGEPNAPSRGAASAPARVVTAPALPRELMGPRSVALELLAPYVEPAPAPSTQSASSFSSSAPPPVPARSADDATRSLVSALQSSSGQAGGDRLSMADMTLISIVAATEQVAAKQKGGDGQFGGTTNPTNQKTTRGHGHKRRRERNFEEDVEKYVDAMLRALSQYHSDSGQGQE